MATATQQVLQGTYNADQGHSTFEASARHMEVGRFRTNFAEVDARLSDETGTFVLEGVAQVESISIRKPAELREHVVYGADFFDAGNHPTITYRSEDVVIGDDGALTVRGDLTIRGVSREIEATGTWQQPVQDPGGNERTAFTLSATIDRRDFGLDWQADLPKGGKALSWEMGISINLELIRES